MKSEPKKRTPRPRASKLEATLHSSPKDDLLIAAIGASAGGIEAFTELMTSLPVDSGMAFVLVQHLDPKHHSLLTELLSKRTAMRVTEVTDGMKVERDHVYVIPPNATMSISNHTLQLRPREESRGLQTNPAEIKSLYQDMLINVTSFFRNPHVFDALQTQVFPSILKKRGSETGIRIWTPACASGEETYSLAIALLEYLGNRTPQVPIQLFGTDVSEPGVTRARSGVYPENIHGDVSAERLQRFFTKVEGEYRISKSIRDMCIFAQHNVLNDPPFSQMDLICCRNLLIYLEPVLQNKVISLFHYAAKPGGFLVLGTSEGVGAATSLFAIEDRTHKIFSKKTTAIRQPVAFSLQRDAEHDDSGTPRSSPKPDPGGSYLEAQKEFDRCLLSQYAPAAVFVNQEMEIIHTRGSVNQYLKLAPGRASLNILKMARAGLLLDLQNAIAKAKKENAAVRRQNVQLKNGNGNGVEPGKDGGRVQHPMDSIQIINFDVIPISVNNLEENFFMIVFQDVVPERERAAASRRILSRKRSEAESGKISRLEQELAATKEYLQSVIETQEATNEELQSANEEILSSNEELQSTNEELETAKEELQSANEELSTVNDELRSRNQGITQANSDLMNIFAIIDVAVIMVGSDLTIRRFTPQAQKFFGLIPGDIGRPLLNINPTIDIPDFQSLVLQVITNSRTVERELSDAKGVPCQLRILPYRTLDNKIDGAVITIASSSSSKPGALGAKRRTPRLIRFICYALDNSVPAGAELEVHDAANLTFP